VNDSEISEALADTTVHVVASGEKAGKTIPHISDYPNTYVISNDRFVEFPEQEAVRRGRVLRHKIIHSRVSVYDLRVDLPFGAAPK